MTDETQNNTDTEETKEEALTEEMQYLEYDDFAKVEMRIGTILAAERVEGTDKLIKCTIDFGEDEPRTIVSGIYEFRTPEELVGKQLPYITNLKPRMIRGVESNGMLLAAGGRSDTFALLHPDVEVAPGSLLS